MNETDELIRVVNGLTESIERLEKSVKRLEADIKIIERRLNRFKF